MGFPAIIGSVYQSARMSALNVKWELKKRELEQPKRELTAEERQIAQLRETAQQTQESNVIAGIDAKLMSGGDLTEQEMAYLRAKNPQKYQEALELRRERAAYRRELSNCKTKEEAQRLNLRKMQEFLSQAKSISSNANIPDGAKKALMAKIQCRVMATQGEYAKFTASSQYAKLPREQDEQDRKKAEKEERTDKEAMRELLDILQQANKQKEPQPVQEAAQPQPEQEAEQPKDEAGETATAQTPEKAAQTTTAKPAAKAPAPQQAAAPRVHTTTSAPTVKTAYSPASASGPIAASVSVATSASVSAPAPQPAPAPAPQPIGTRLNKSV